MRAMIRATTTLTILTGAPLAAGCLQDAPPLYGGSFCTSYASASAEQWRPRPQRAHPLRRGAPWERGVADKDRGREWVGGGVRRVK